MKSTVGSNLIYLMGWSFLSGALRLSTLYSFKMCYIQIKNGKVFIRAGGRINQTLTPGLEVGSLFCSDVVVPQRFPIKYFCDMTERWQAQKTLLQSIINLSALRVRTEPNSAVWKLLALAAAQRCHSDLPIWARLNAISLAE